MTTITLLGGAGLMGSGIVRDLISDLAICEFKLLQVCDASPERMAALLAELDDPRLEAHQFDAGEPDRVRALIQGADLCINAVPTLDGVQMSIFETALAERVPYMDLGGLGVFTVEQKGWYRRFVEAGVTAVVGAGRRNRAPATVRCEVLVGPDARYAPYLDATTSMNASIAAQLVLTSEPMPGVWAPEALFDVKRCFVESDRRGFRVRTEIS